VNLTRHAFGPGVKRHRPRRAATAVLAAAAIVSAVGGSVGAARPQSGEPVTIRWFVGLGTGTEPEQLEAQ
jgi:ABC-type glycerol-3-phosphate transport system substrate-binding protein